MPTELISVPVAVNLADGRNWERVDGKRDTYWVMRFHLALHDEAVAGEPLRMGDRISTHYAEDAQVQGVREMRVDMTTVDVSETVRESILTNELVTNVAQELSAGLGSQSAAANLGVNVKRSVETHAGRTETSRTSTQHSVTRVESINFNLTYDFAFSGHDLVNVAMCERRSVEVYLVWLDYLQISYERSAWGLRKRRVKLPALEEGRKHRMNEIQMNIPLGSLLYWKIMPESSHMIRAERYLAEVPDSSEVVFEMAARPRVHDRKVWRRMPTLYQLSNAAFPLRWTKREGPWTEADLMAIELEEARDSIWWFQHGPGKRAALKR